MDGQNEHMELSLYKQAAYAASDRVRQPDNYFHSAGYCMLMLR